MIIAKLYTEDEIRDIIAEAIVRIGDEVDDVKHGMVTAMVGTRIAAEVQKIIEEHKERAKNGKKED